MFGLAWAAGPRNSKKATHLFPFSPFALFTPLLAPIIFLLSSRKQDMQSLFVVVSDPRLLLFMSFPYPLARQGLP